ncbi:MAG: MFS transporter [Hyphomicrobiales bacterium]
MSRAIILSLYFAACFVQSGTYGLTFLLPDLFQTFGANEKNVGQMLAITTVATLIAVYFAGHLADKIGRMRTLSLSGALVAASLILFSLANLVGFILIVASILLGLGWGLFYSLTPVVLTRITDASERIRTFALLSMFIMGGFGTSPVLAAWLQDVDVTIPEVFQLMGLLCLGSGLLFFAITTRVQALAENATTEPASKLDWASLKRIMQSPAWLPITMALFGASVFAGMTNFQTVFANARGLDYSIYFLVYTLTVISCRLLLIGFKGGSSPYRTIAALQAIMAASVVVFILMQNTQPLYILVAIMFGIGYGASYPILAAMAANDARDGLVPQTLQLFALSYFIGIFGFPLIAGSLIVWVGHTPLLVIVAILASIEACMAALRSRNIKALNQPPR